MALDVISNSPLICFTSKYKAIGKENLVGNQKSLFSFFFLGGGGGAFLHATLQFYIC